MKTSFYFDHAASGIPDEEIARLALEESLAYFSNPSSAHPLGKKAKERLEYWRSRAAEILHAQPSQIIFTSGATEANQLILSRLFLNKDAHTHIVASGIEHASVHENLLMLKNLGFSVSFVNPEDDGRISTHRFLEQINEKTRLAVLMLVNNETGAIQPAGEIIQAIRNLPYGRHIHIHTDAVQPEGYRLWNFHALDCDSACLSAHKIGGPRGIGILYVKKNLSTLLRGGGQEKDMRAGTENLFGICGCVLALEKIYKENKTNIDVCRLWLDRLVAMGAAIFPQKRLQCPENFSPNIISFAFPPLPGEVLMRLLGEQGVYVGTGSACGQNKKDRLRVLLSMKIPDKIAECAVRVSFSRAADLKSSRQALDILEEIIALQRKMLHF